MTETEGFALVSELAVRCSGFNDASIEAYVRDLCRLEHPKAAALAVRHVANTWTETWKPSWGVVLSAYHTQVRREQMSAPALPSGRGAIPVSEGRRVAARAYVSHCERLGREPSETILAGFLGAIGDDK